MLYDFFDVNLLQNLSIAVSLLIKSILYHTKDTSYHENYHCF